MSKNILLVYAHPEPASLTCQLADIASQTLQAQGHTVVHSDLYAMQWKAAFDAHDFPQRLDGGRLSLIAESGHAYASGQQTADVIAEQQKLLAADAVILLFPLWWFGLPAILKGWIDRVFAYGFAYGYQGEGNRYRYGDGLLQGKRAMLAVMVGGGERDYGPRGINGSLEQLLFPVTHGNLFYTGMTVLPTHAVYGTGQISAAGVGAAKRAWQQRLGQLFDEAPIPFRTQNGGDYPDGHQLGSHIASGQGGLAVHLADG